MGAALSLLMLSLVSLVSEAKTLNVRMVEAPVSLDWNEQVTLSEAPIIMNICEGLFTWQYPDEKLIPGLASEIKKSKDFTEYTFKINKRAKWSDGRAVFAQDFVNSWLRLLSPNSASIYTYYLFDIVNAREFNSKKITSLDAVGIKATDDHTLVVKLKHSIQNWEINTAFWPLFPIRKDLIDKYGANWWRAGLLISSGPFIFESSEPGEKNSSEKKPSLLSEKQL